MARPSGYSTLWLRPAGAHRRLRNLANKKSHIIDIIISGPSDGSAAAEGAELFAIVIITVIVIMIVLMIVLIIVININIAIEVIVLIIIILIVICIIIKYDYQN